MIRTVLLAAIVLLAGLHLACASRLDEEQVRTRLVTELHLANDKLHVRSITRARLPVVVIDYGGAPATFQFRRQDEVWVIESVEREGRWEPGAQALALVGRELAAKARAAQMADLMPRYARTLKLLVGWSTLLGADCSTGLPASERAVLALHSTWHRTIFASRNGEFVGEFHNPDLFVRDAWWRPFRLTFSAPRLDVRSSGPDGRMDTADDVEMTYTRVSARAGMTVCRPSYTLPADAIEALGRPDAPAAWNCADLIAAFKKGDLIRPTTE